ncbi:MAG: hypothetical protein F9K44_12880 [Hyphomicrobiaceae bacterium]|nr:MAG: hypothetical protein F9K44_12880 [Hyphomicrobiaceae bacterium]
MPGRGEHRLRRRSRRQVRSRACQAGRALDPSGERGGPRLIRLGGLALDFELTDDQKSLKEQARKFVREVTGNALQLMGGYSYSKAFSAEQRLRDAWGWGIAGGTIDIQKINIASALLGRRFDQRR